MYCKLQISIEKKSTSQESYLQLQNPGHHPSYQRLKFFVVQYVLKEILTQLKQNNNIDAKLNKTINLLIRNVNSFIAIAKQEKLNEQGKVKNFIPSTEYEEILRGLTLFTLNTSFNKIINLTTSKEKINIYKKEDVE